MTGVLRTTRALRMTVHPVILRNTVTKNLSLRSFAYAQNDSLPVILRNTVTKNLSQRSFAYA